MLSFSSRNLTRLQAESHRKMCQLFLYKPLEPERVRRVVEILRRTSPEIQDQDLRFLICRTPLGPMQLPNYPLSREETLQLLQNLENFVFE